MILRSLVLAFGVAAAAPAIAQTPADYAYHIALQTSGDSAFFRVELPADVYEGAVRSDLGDVRVFNAHGEPVAYAFVPRASATREAAGSVSLPLFPLRVDAARTDLSDVSISVRKDASGTSVNLATKDGQAVASQRLAGYLIDASELKEPLVALSLPFATAANVTTRVRIDASDDLAGWRTVVADAPLLDLEFAGRRLTRSRIELPRTVAKYIRVTFAAGQPAPDIARADAQYGERVAETPRQWRAVPGAAIEGKAGDFTFDLGGTFPVDRITLELGERNTVAPAQLFTRAAPGDEWQSAGAGVFYRLWQDGGEIVNPPLALSVPARRYWRVRIDEKAGATGAQPPRLSAGWYPHVIVFTARGDGPFDLAYGSRRVTPSALPIATLVPGYDIAKGLPATLPAARAGTAVGVSASAALREPIDVKKWGLWAVLIVASIFLGWMALRLSRRMGARPSERHQASDAKPD